MPGCGAYKSGQHWKTRWSKDSVLSSVTPSNFTASEKCVEEPATVIPWVPSIVDSRCRVSKITASVLSGLSRSAYSQIPRYLTTFKFRELLYQAPSRMMAKFGLQSTIRTKRRPDRLIMSPFRGDEPQMLPHFQIPVQHSVTAESGGALTTLNVRARPQTFPYSEASNHFHT